MAIDATDDGRLDYMIAENIGSNVGFALGKLEQNWNKKLQELKEQETAKAIVAIASNPNLNEKQRLEQFQKVSEGVNINLNEMQKMALQQFDQINRQNAAIAPQVKSQMFEAARGMDFNNLSPEMMANERRQGSEANAYAQLDRATGFSVPELGQMAQPTNQPLDGRMSDVFGRPLQGTTQDTFSGLTNTFNAGVASGKEQLSKPQGKYGTMPWWMHPDYKDTPEGIAAMKYATRIKGTGTDIKPVTESDKSKLREQAIEWRKRASLASNPTEAMHFISLARDAETKTGDGSYENPMTTDEMKDIFKAIIKGNKDISGVGGKYFGTATPGAVQKAYNKFSAQGIARGNSLADVNQNWIALYNDFKNNEGIDKILPEGSKAEDFILEDTQPEQPSQEQPEYATDSGVTTENTQGVVGNKLTMPGAKSKVDNPQQFINKLPPEKKALVEKALKNGYTIEEIRQALGE